MQQLSRLQCHADETVKYFNGQIMRSLHLCATEDTGDGIGVTKLILSNVEPCVSMCFFVALTFFLDFIP